MRPRGVSVAAIAAVVVVAGYFTIVLDLAQPAWPMSATGTPPPDGGAGNVLQPIGPGLAWHYRTEGIWQGGVDRVFILGSERVEGEDRWLLERRVGTTDANRLEIVRRSGDLWLVAWSRIGEHGGWVRMAAAEPALWQPGPRDHAWPFTFYGRGREIDKKLKRGGTRTVLGQRRRLWLLEDHWRGATSEPSVTTIAEGIGPIEFDGPSYVGSGPLRLVDFRDEAPSLTRTFEAWTRHGTDGRGDETWSLELAEGGGGTIENTRDGASGLRWIMRDGRTIDLTAEPGGLTFRWTGRLESVGLLGTATFRDKRFVLEFVPR